MSTGETSVSHDGGVRTVFSGKASRGWRVGFGLVTAIAGVLIIAWPEIALVTVAVILGLHLIVAGIVRMVTAITRDIDTGTMRTLYLLLGLLLLVVGILCLRSPFRAAAALMLLFGLSWIVNGVIELFHGLTGGGGWTIVSGVVSLAAGIVVLAYPTPSIRTMVWLFGIALIAIGLVTTVEAVVARSRPRRSFAPGDADTRPDEGGW